MIEERTSQSYGTGPDPVGHSDASVARSGPAPTPCQEATDDRHAFLQEVGKLKAGPAEILDALQIDADLGVAEGGFSRASAIAATLTWTRGPFDRMIVAHALADDLPLITGDRTILANCPVARWA